jgi:hypothetical protein
MDMKTYEVLINGEPMTNEYIRGRISGFIAVLTGMPDKGYPWRTWEDGLGWTTRYDATEEQHEAIRACIEKYYPNAYAGVKVIEK